MRCCFEEDPDAEITQIALWQAYQTRFTEFTTHGAGRALLPAADFIKNVSVAFGKASAMVISQQGQSKFIIKGIRSRESPMAVDGTVYIPCRWRQATAIQQGPHGVGRQYLPCTTQCRTRRDLFDHILKNHIPQVPQAAPVAPIVNGGDIQMGGAAVDPSLASIVPIQYFCHWDKCTIYSYPTTDRNVLLSHIKTHLPPPLAPGEAPKTQQDAHNRTVYNTLVKSKYENSDPRVALSATLLLKNFARNRAGKEILYGVRDKICEVAVLQDVGAMPNDPQTQIGRDLRKYLMELMVDSDLVPASK